MTDVRQWLAEASEEEKAAYYAALATWLDEMIRPLVDPRPRIADDLPDGDDVEG